jgi:AcrR family transcriptional regulator
MAHEVAQSIPEVTDPRILRSRRMLMDALTSLLAKKDFEDISVQEIADEATLNRATFYLHYPDKGTLLHALSDFRFRDLMARRGISFTNCDGALRAIALGVCDYLTDISKCPVKGVRNTLDGAVISVVEGMFKEGLAKHGTVPGVDVALLATTAAWAIFGTASRWYQTPDRIPAEEMAVKIEAMVKPVFLAAANG